VGHNTTAVYLMYVYRSPIVDRASLSVNQVHGSAQASPRHTRMSTYCCFLPDLTGFMGSCCAGPGRQHQSLEADLKDGQPRMGIRPRYSGLRVQGTATSPLSTAIIIILTITAKCNHNREVDTIYRQFYIKQLFFPTKLPEKICQQSTAFVVQDSASNFSTMIEPPILQ